jgi:hypothetical protein
MASKRKFVATHVALYTLHFTNPQGQIGEMDFLPGEKQTAEQMAQDYANWGYNHVRLAAVSYSQRRKAPYRHDYEIVGHYQRRQQLLAA